MRLAFSPQTHTYTADGRVLPSVTQILRAVGLYDSYAFAEPHHRYRGQAIHQCSAIIDMGGVVESISAPPHLAQVRDDILNGYLPAFVAFKERTRWQGRIWECPMVQTVLGFGGSFDAVGECGDEVVLLDLKSGVMPPLVPAQLAFYWLLITTGTPINPDHAGYQWLQQVIADKRPVQRWALRLEKTGKDTLFTETAKSESFNSPKWDSLAKSSINLYNMKAAYGLLEERK
jgi:hypothetical protein